MVQLVKGLEASEGQSSSIVTGFSIFSAHVKLAGVMRALTVCMSNYRSRRQLQMLSAEALKDIGISRTEALAEAGRPCWDSSKR